MAKARPSSFAICRALSRRRRSMSSSDLMATSALLMSLVTAIRNLLGMHTYGLGGRRIWVTPAKSNIKSPTPLRVRAPEDDIPAVDADSSYPTWPPNHTLWVGGFPKATRWSDLRTMFEVYGKVDDISLIRMTSNSRGTYAHVRCRSLTIAERLMSRHAWRPFRVFICRKSCPVMLEYAPPAPVHHEPHNKLFARMVDGDETGIRALFGSHAQNIRKIEFYDHSKVDPVIRAAYIEFDTTEEATAAKDAVNQQSVNGRSRLVLSYAKKGPSDGKSKKPSSPVYLPVPQWKSVYEGVEISPDAVERMKSLGLMTPPLPESQR
ncbi:uncharacterized protein C8Q71DRAFT_566845 [Rhodofomes roseus]|uniref:RRM domain-containing protein n=1 Tax=Rhodofomes roseus TaxID=34475 RepID=A0ABQ8KIV8_9APHY|nr:uncharacterized protein C8Q71DRAFT_566845 [Rhodofomes roseus]KAH9837888.1 hypothetical protein C8Q71DRAFT_566845 [Rhodofomes roseus]